VTSPQEIPAKKQNQTSSFNLNLHHNFHCFTLIAFDSRHNCSVIESRCDSKGQHAECSHSPRALHVEALRAFSARKPLEARKRQAGGVSPMVIGGRTGNSALLQSPGHGKRTAPLHKVPLPLLLPHTHHSFPPLPPSRSPSTSSTAHTTVTPWYTAAPPSACTNCSTPSAGPCMPCICAEDPTGNAPGVPSSTPGGSAGVPAPVLGKGLEAEGEGGGGGGREGWGGGQPRSRGRHARACSRRPLKRSLAA